MKAQLNIPFIRWIIRTSLIKAEAQIILITVSVFYIGFFLQFFFGEEVQPSKIYEGLAKLSLFTYIVTFFIIFMLTDDMNPKISKSLSLSLKACFFAALSLFAGIVLTLSWVFESSFDQIPLLILVFIIFTISIAVCVYQSEGVNNLSSGFVLNSFFVTIGIIVSMLFLVFIFI